MKTVIEMAREAGGGLESDYINISALERLVELARADEREKYKWDVHSCGPTCKRYACVAMREAVEAEREAIIDLVAFYGGPVDLEAAIRARGSET
jgi:hypothetical protein